MSQGTSSEADPGPGQPLEPARPETGGDGRSSFPRPTAEAEGAPAAGREARIETGTSRSARLAARVLAPLLPLAILLWTGFAGLDFGRHWDEWLQMRSVQTAVQQETLLPGFYNYPSVSFWVAFGALAPEIAADPPTRRTVRDRLKPVLEQVVMTDAFRLRVRGAFLVVSSLVVIWTYLCHLRWRGRAGEALLAAALAGLSWELAYHARWIAPDAINAQVATLCMLFLVGGFRSARPLPWLLAAAAAAGLATGTKYPSGLLLAPVLLALLLRRSALRGPSTEARAVGRTLLLCLGLFCATFLATTPGALLQPTLFIADVRYEIRHYGIGHFGYTVEQGRAHLAAILRYLGGTALSPWTGLSYALAGLTLVGIAALVRESRGLALVLLAFPVTYLLYMSTTRVLFVRNLLVVLPFMALLGARGAGGLGSLLPERLGRHLPLALAAILVAAHGTWLFHAADTIRERETARAVRELDRWLERRDGPPVLITPALRDALDRHAPRQQRNVTLDPDAGAQLAAFYPPPPSPELGNLPSNRPGSVVRWFGPREVNLEYYWTWLEPRIVVTTTEYARSIEMVPAPD